MFFFLSIIYSVSFLFHSFSYTSLLFALFTQCLLSHCSLLILLFPSFYELSLLPSPTYFLPLYPFSLSIPSESFRSLFSSTFLSFNWFFSFDSCPNLFSILSFLFAVFTQVFFVLLCSALTSYFILSVLWILYLFSSMYFLPLTPLLCLIFLWIFSLFFLLYILPFNRLLSLTLLRISFVSFFALFTVSFLSYFSAHFCLSFISLGPRHYT